MTQASTPSPASQWGYQHPDCHGENALMFFTWDLGRVIASALNEPNSDLEAALPQAQAAVDALLHEYVQRKASPEAFEGQAIVLRLETATDDDGDSSAFIALQTTPHLEQLIIESQARMQNNQPGATKTH